MTSFLAGALILPALLLPLTFWLGLIRGSIVLIALLVIAAAVQTARYWNELQVGRHLNSPVESLAMWVGDSDSPTGIPILLLIIAMGWWVSCRISERLYSRRDL